MMLIYGKCRKTVKAGGFLFMDDLGNVHEIDLNGKGVHETIGIAMQDCRKGGYVPIFYSPGRLNLDICSPPDFPLGKGNKVTIKIPGGKPDV